MRRINNLGRLISVILVFVLFIILLSYSYIHKLGYLSKATYTVFFILIFLILVNFFKDIRKERGILFWLTMLVIFTAGFVDKSLHIHILIGKTYFGAFKSNSGIMVQAIYLIIFGLLIAFFRKYLIKEYTSNPDCVYLFLFAYILSVIGLLADLQFKNTIEDYFELFSLYFFAASFLSALITTKNKNENSNISSSN